jgi:hypothetical protein
MKIKLTFKDPDGVWESINQAARDSLDEVNGISKDERESLLEFRHEELSSALAKWIKYGEYCSVEFDTEAGTARVVEGAE